MTEKSNNVSEKGFTIIELLVVVAIIGVLAAVVLASLSSSRTRAEDSKIRSQLNAIIPAAQIYYDILNAGNWSGVCTNQSQINIDNMVISATNNRTTGNCSGSGQAGWKAWARLSNGQYWCVDYSASSKTCDVAPSGSVGGFWSCQTASPYNCI